MHNTSFTWPVLISSLLSLAAIHAQGVPIVPAATEDISELAPVEVSGLRSSSYRPAYTGSATLTEVPLEEVPVSVDVVTRELMESRDTDTIDDVLKFESGVFNGGQTFLSRTAGQYTMRGLSGSDVQINGMPLPGGMGFALDASLLERVEFVKGPVGSVTGGQTSTLGAYGAGGSVSLVLKEPELNDFTRLDLSARMGEGQRYRAAFDSNVVSGDQELAVRTVGSYWVNKPFWHHGGDWGSGFSISPSILWQPADKAKLMLQLSYQYQDMPSYQGIPVFEGQFFSNYDAWFGGPDARTIYEGLIVQLSGEVKANSTWTFRGGMGMGMAWLDYDLYGISSSPTTYASVLETGIATYEYAWSEAHNTSYNVYGHALAKFDMGPIENEALIGADFTSRIQSGYSGAYARGFSHSVDVWNPTRPLYGRDRSTKDKRDSTLNKTGLILQDMASWESWRLLLSARTDAHFSNKNNDAVAFSPRAGLTRLFGKHVAVFGNVSLTEAPNFGYDDEFGNELTDHWRAVQYEGGFRVNPVDDLWFTATAFRIEQNHTPIDVGPGTDSYYASEGENVSTGVELSLKGSITSYWDSSLSYTYIHYKDITNGITFDRFPPHSVSLWQTLKIPVGNPEPFRVSVGYRFSAEYFATFRGEKITTVTNQKRDYTIPSFNVFDLVFELPLPANDWHPACSVRFGVYNIFDEKYVSSMRHAAQCFVGDPRSFELALKMSF